VPHAETQSVEDFGDRTALFLGGRAGFFTIGGTATAPEEKVCVREDGCGLFPVEPVEAPPELAPESVGRCAGSPTTYCTENDSFRNNFFFYFSIGSETETTTGGFRRERDFCWRTIRRCLPVIGCRSVDIPWVCTRDIGFNSLTIHSTFLSKVNALFFTAREGRTTRVNTRTAQVKLWAVFGSIPPKGICSGDFTPFECELTAVCSTHDSQGEGGATLDVRTAAGEHRCPR